MIWPGHITAVVQHLAASLPLAAIDDRLVGKWLFASLFALLILWLFLIPRERLGQRDQIPNWWRNVRFWAIVIASVQLVVYALWG